MELYFGEYDRALDQLRQAIELNGSEAQSHEGLLAVLLFRGDLQGAIAAGETLAQLQPDMSDAAAFHLGMAYVLADRGADAVRVLQRLLVRNPEFLYGKVQLAAAYAETGRQPEAEQLAAEIRRRYPNFSEDSHKRRRPDHSASAAADSPRSVPASSDRADRILPASTPGRLR